MNRSYADAPRLPDGPAIDPRTLFDLRDGPVEVEIGPGHGGFLYERLASKSDLRMLGLEARLKWASLVDARLRQQGFGNRARVFAEDARLALPRLVSGSLSAVHVHFPDPWWKKRHQKRLLVTERLVQEVARLLAPGGEFFLQTDVSERARAYEEVIRAEPALRPVLTAPEVPDNPYHARSPRERRAMADGMPILRLWYRKA